MKASLQERVAPYQSVNSQVFNGGEVKANDRVIDGDGKNKIDFKALMTNSNTATKRERDAKKINGFTGNETQEEFLKKLSEQSGQQPVTRTPKNSLGKDDFLKLFITQLQHQDPLNPEDSSEMASRLAHFNSLEQMMNVNKTLDKMFELENSNTNLGMTNFIDKEITLKGGRLRIDDKGLNEAFFDVKQDAASVTLEVRDSTGSVVFEKDLGNVLKGQHQLDWNGKTVDDEQLPQGIYQFSIVAHDTNQQEIPVDITTKAFITGVDLLDKEGGIYTTFGKAKLTDIISVGKPGYEQNKNVKPEQKQAAGLNPQAAAASGIAGVKNLASDPTAVMQAQNLVPGEDSAAVTQTLIPDDAAMNAAQGFAPKIEPESINNKANGEQSTDLNKLAKDNPEGLTKIQSEIKTNKPAPSQEATNPINNAGAQKTSDSSTEEQKSVGSKTDDGKQLDARTKAKKKDNKDAKKLNKISSTKEPYLPNKPASEYVPMKT